MASYVTPKRGAAYEFYVSLTSQADVKLFQDNPTLAPGDVIVIKDGTLDGNIDTLPVAIVGATRVLKVVVSVAEMTADNTVILFHDVAGAEWSDLVVNIQTSARQIDDLAATGADADTLETLSDQIDAVPAAPTVAQIAAAVQEPPRRQGLWG